MQLIESFNFKINDNTDDLTKKYPNIEQKYFSMSLQIESGFLSANVAIEYTTKSLTILIYDENNEPIQPRIWVNDNVELLFIVGYSLIYNKKLQQFEFYKV